MTILLLGLFGSPAYGADYPFENPALPIDQRVADLVGRLTPEQKVSQMSMTGGDSAAGHPDTPGGTRGCTA